MIVTGILVAYLSNATIAGLVGGDTAWRWKLGVTAAPALIFFILLFAIPNSPRWLLAKGRREEAGMAMVRIGAPTAADRESVGWGKSVSITVDLGGGRIMKNKTKNYQHNYQP